ncbi:protein ENDOSPERM DEFECTIVE 1-like [Chenopodium quinoa]|uniref:protein ENDOSPERM DEFECTIVE 1-like n=1 Tax=Chenopodium quinoa TaxID=63459 RepID=UPI000B7997AB|nr:protein ENDOSPERM DEFECTIVE 1-like [Chenopodium quinoa]
MSPPTMASENPKPHISSEISTPMPTNPQHPRRSRPRVREVSSRFMSPAAKPPTNIQKQIPSTPSESQISKNNALRRSNTDFRPSQSRYADENRPDSLNRKSVSPVRSSSKPRAAVKLFKEGSRTDTPVPMQVGPRLVRQRSWDSAASKLLQANGICSNGEKDDDDGGCSVNGDCESVKSEPNDNNNCTSNGDNNNCQRNSTPCSRSMEFSYPSNDQQQQQNGGLNSIKGVGNDDKLFHRSVNKVARSLNLPPMPPGLGFSRPQGGTVEVKKAVVRKGGNQLDDAQRLKLLHNLHLQYRFANAKAEACLNSQKKQSEKLLYSMGVKISELQDSVKSKRVEVGLLKEAKLLSTILDTQVPVLDEWSALEEAYSSSLLELTQGLQNISSRLPLNGNVKVNIKEINEAMNSALKVAESICLQVQGFVPKAEQVDVLISDLARVHSGEVTLVQECGDLLSRTHLSQIEECSLRGQLIQFQKCNLTGS